MTSPAEVRNYLAAGRSASVDWFPEGTLASSIGASMVGMANAAGGVLILGVAPRSNRIQGVGDADTGRDVLVQSALLAEPPLILPMPETVALDGVHVLVASVPTGLPHVYALDGRYWIREGRANEPISARRLRHLLLERGEIAFESDVPDGVTLDDLDSEKVEAYCKVLGAPGATAPQAALLQRGCAVRRRAGLTPTLAGLLLFGRQPQRWLPSAFVATVRVTGRELGDEFVREEIGGTLPEQLTRAEAFLHDHMRRGVRLSGMTREERLEYPLPVVREALVNAVAHREYAVRGDHIRAMLFSDRLEVTSPGRLPGPVTVSNIVHERFSRNVAIVQVLADLGYIERLGYGIDRMIALMRQHGLRRPHFEETAGGFRVTLFGAGDNVPEVQAFEPARWAELQLNLRQEQALKYLASHRRITNRELQDLCPGVHAETIRRDLADLVSKGALIRIGDKRATYYILKERS